jgi:carboxyl-terminal processing protease
MTKPPFAHAVAAAARVAAASLLCLSLAGPPRASLAAEPRGSPVAREVAALVDKYFLDRSFNGVDLKATLTRLEASDLTEQQALDESTRLVSSLGDRYTRVLAPEQASKLGKYDVTGVGINLVIADSGAVTVGAVPPADSDAAKLGVTFGDVVTAINGRAAEGMTSFDALEAIQSDGDSVSLTLKPAAGGQSREVVLKKAFQQRNPVTYHLVEGEGGLRVGYVKLNEFNAQCKRAMREALADMQLQGATRVILDLRGNGGGVLDGALGIAGLFLDKPLVLYVTDANHAQQPLYSREPGGGAPLAGGGLPLQIWVDARTASSAEVLAAALKDNCRAQVLGGTTYGKGVIQGVFGLSDGGALVETVASYATPSGEEINLKGVKPDEDHIFISDVLGSSYVDADVKALSKASHFREVPARGMCATAGRS